jgi:hypothetical protein
MEQLEELAAAARKKEIREEELEIRITDLEAELADARRLLGKERAAHLKTKALAQEWLDGRKRELERHRRTVEMLEGWIANASAVFHRSIMSPN